MTILYKNDTLNIKQEWVKPLDFFLGERKKVFGVFVIPKDPASTSLMISKDKYGVVFFGGKCQPKDLEYKTMVRNAEYFNGVKIKNAAFIGAIKETMFSSDNQVIAEEYKLFYVSHKFNYFEVKPDKGALGLEREFYDIEEVEKLLESEPKIYTDVLNELKSFLKKEQ